MFKQFFILGLVSAIGASLAGFVYSSFYYSEMADFSEAMSLIRIISFAVMICFGACIINFGIRRGIKKENVADFVFNALFALATIAMIFIVLKAQDPVFQNEDAQIMAEYYKGFVMPMLFFPVLSWFTFKPLFLK